MKKTLMSIALGLVLAAAPVAILAACADVITIRSRAGVTRVCNLIRSSHGGAVCYYSCL